MADLGVALGRQLVADEAGAGGHHEDDRADDVGQFQAPDRLRRVGDPGAHLVSDHGQNVEGEEDRAGCGQFRRGGQAGIDQTHPLPPAVEPEFVGDVCRDGPHHDREAGRHGAHQEHQCGEDREVPLGQEGQTHQTEGIDGGRHQEGDVLADLVREPGGEGRPGETGRDVDQQQQVGGGGVKTPTVLEVEQVERGHPARPQRDHQVGGQQPDHVSPGEQLGIILERELGRPILCDALR